jgi:RNA polymerase sigma-70 factor (ECF subfamily)
MAAPAIAAWSIPQSLCKITTDFETRPAPAQPSDEALVASAKLGDAIAFERLMERHYRFCLAKAYSILRNHGDAEDETQNACAKAWKHLTQFEGNGTFGGWISRIVSNQCLMRIRERKGARMVSVDEVFDSEGSFRLEVIDQRALPEESVGDDEVSCMLNREISRVPPLLREALIMRDLRQLTMRDIAAHLGISIPAAKSRLMRARHELKLRLAKHHGGRGCGTLLHKTGRRRAAYVRAN